MIDKLLNKAINPKNEAKKMTNSSTPKTTASKVLLPINNKNPIAPLQQELKLERGSTTKNFLLVQQKNIFDKNKRIDKPAIRQIIKL